MTGTERDLAAGTPASFAIGTAGWAIPRATADQFPGDGSHLERYARQFSAVEINSSFHRPHRATTYARWAAAVPVDFGFSVKLPRTTTHERRLIDAADLLDAFAEQIAGLGDKLKVLLVQLPPSLAFDVATAEAFVTALRQRTNAAIACEPRHPSWFTIEADALLLAWHVARVAAHPVLFPGGERSGGWQGLHYRRLHGAPRVYYSPYEPAFLEALAETLRATSPAAQHWCVFDNTASGAATGDALALRSLLFG